MEFTPVEGTSDVSGARFVEQLPMKIAPTTVMADDGGVLDVVPLSGIVVAVCVIRLGMLRGKP